MLQLQRQPGWVFLRNQNTSLQALCASNAMEVSECDYSFREVHLSSERWSHTQWLSKSMKNAINHILAWHDITAYVQSAWAHWFTLEWGKCLGKGQFLLFLLFLVPSPRYQHAQAEAEMQILRNFVSPPVPKPPPWLHESCSGGRGDLWWWSTGKHTQCWNHDVQPFRGH